ncbi:MAG: DUF937 domain-containing protein [Flavobacteriales bacterium]|nr:DUF937 domain-containing protein [Flavobacteriales bacterium]MEB2341888.1 DUF937 domain-containing protein [Flavobacteriia bacterium]
MSDLLDSVEQQFTLELMQRTAVGLGQSHTATGRALAGLIPTVMAAMANKSTDGQAMGALYNMLKEAASNPALKDLDGLIDSGKMAYTEPGNPARELIGTLFGGDTGKVEALIRAFSGVKANNTAPLLGMAGAMVMRGLGHKVASGMTQGNLANQLGKERNSIASAVPYEVGLMLNAGMA